MKGYLYIKEVEKKGRGFFCSVPLAAGELIELCQLLVFNPDDFADVGMPLPPAAVITTGILR